ncbi:hypothetical protein AVEN_106797-1 [Araneus ventricosus]|uniref:Uncharacterized protein n=1 Tax=Araneus ventricosus TaxID=182803 RepID=A0A4Y2TKE4_ARAVE|nr:hypothetical protein AVEN_106797-1 [Araneus ventricosus]
MGPRSSNKLIFSTYFDIQVVRYDVKICENPKSQKAILYLLTASRRTLFHWKNDTMSSFSCQTRSRNTFYLKPLCAPTMATGTSGIQIARMAEENLEIACGKAHEVEW